MPEAGDLIGPYRLVSELGRGAMGEVWRARDERLDRYVALKVLPADAALDVERRARMLREARAAAAIRHANVVTLFDIVSHKSNDILVMELVEGRTLGETLRKDGAPPLETALRWIEGIADALVAAHARGILHRDIKAANIMITPDGVKVLDFGLAKLLSDAASPDRADLGAAPTLAPDDLADSGPNASNTSNAARASRKLDAPDRSVALDKTMPSEPNAIPRALDATAHAGLAPAAGTGSEAATSLAIDSYRTHVGQLLGTPLYMAPEQIEGALPDEKSEVFSLGVLAHEIIAGKPPYTATSLDELFRQITRAEPPPLPDVPSAVESIVLRALAKSREQRYATMLELRDAVAAERRRLFAPRGGRTPWIVAAVVGTLAIAAALWWWRTHRAPPVQPGDEYVQRALEEYDVFYNEKALSSLRAALATAPQHARANAYMLLLGGASDADRAKALATAHATVAILDEHGRDRALLSAAIALAEDGPLAARAALAAAQVDPDRELAFWAAELDYRAGKYAEANDEYKALLTDPAHAFRGRIYDHYSSVLLYLDDPVEALRIGTLYRDAFPGEADAVGVYATTLAANGDHQRAIAAAEEALRLSEGEDTLAGLAKVTALSGDHRRARELYQRSLERAPPGRRTLRRAALGFLQWIDGDVAMAKTTVAPCLPGGADATLRERGACLFVAALIDPARVDEVAFELDALASDPRPPYGAPAALAKLVRARATFFGGGCVVDPARADVRPVTPGQPTLTPYDALVDFFAAYHVPFFATWALCERAAVIATTDRAKAADVLRPTATRAPNRTWLLAQLRLYAP